MVRKVIFVASLALATAACGSSSQEPSGGDPGTDTDSGAVSASSSSGSSGGADESPAASSGSSSGGSSSGSSDGSSSGAAAGDDGGSRGDCPDVDGDWTGTVMGQATGLAAVAVNGTMAVMITGSSATGTLTLNVVGLSLAPQTFSGMVDCGKISGTKTVMELGETVTTTVNATLTSASGMGTWSATSTDGLIKASGTFTMTHS